MSSAHLAGVLSTPAEVPAANTVPAAVRAAYVVGSVATPLAVATPPETVVAEPAEPATVIAEVFLVNDTGSPSTGWPVAVSVTLARSGNAADVHTAAAPSWPSAVRASDTGRAVPVAKVSGLVTLLVAPVESVSVAVTVVAPVALAGQ